MKKRTLPAETGWIVISDFNADAYRSPAKKGGSASRLDVQKFEFRLGKEQFSVHTWWYLPVKVVVKLYDGGYLREIGAGRRAYRTSSLHIDNSLDSVLRYTTWIATDPSDEAIFVHTGSLGAESILNKIQSVLCEFHPDGVRALEIRPKRKRRLMP